MAIIANRLRKSNTIFGMTHTLQRVFARISILILIILSLQLIYLGPQNAVNTFAFGVSSKIIEVTLTGYGEVISSIRRLSELISSALNLRQENIKLKLELAKLKSIEDLTIATHKENERLKTQLHYAKTLPYESITGRIVSTSTDLYRKSAIVRVERDQGVETGQIVVNNDGVLGRIIEVSDHYSRVLLITDFGSKIPALSSVSSIQVVVSGNNTENPNVLYAQGDKHIKLGELLITSGDGKYYPPGLKIAKVSKIIDKEIQVTPSASLSNADLVNIIKMPHNQ
jgi:rod shape-determining protein MreC